MGSKERPPINLDDLGTLYEYYHDLQPNTLAQKALLAASAAAYKPQISYDEGAEEAIIDTEKRGSALLMGCNHINVFDQNAVGATLFSERAFKGAIGNTFVPAKVEYFMRPRLRKVMEAIGAVPVIRPQDIQHIPDNLRLQARAGRLLIQTASQRLNNGQHMFIFPEGTRNKGDLRELGEIKGGIGKIAKGVVKREVVIVPMALWYGENPSLKDTLTPNLHIGTPIEGPFKTSRQVVSPLNEALEHCLREAIERNELQTTVDLY